MYSYEFSVKKDTAYFKGIDEKIIAIDKEDMIHVLSANGHWTVKENKVLIDSPHLKRNIELSEYLLFCNPSTLYHVNGNYLDFRKKNLITKNSRALQCYIRPWGQNFALYSFTDNDFLCQKWFAIKSFHQIIGYFGLFPISNDSFNRLVAKSDESFEKFSLQYENDVSYHHVLLGNIPTNNQTMRVFHSFYSRFIEHLLLRNITIHHLITPSYVNTDMLLSFMAKKEVKSGHHLYHSGTFCCLRF